MTEQDINSRFHDLMKATWDAFDSAVILRLGFIEYYGYPEYYPEGFAGLVNPPLATSIPENQETTGPEPTEPKPPEVEPPGTDLTDYLARTVHTICEMTSSCLDEIPATPYSIFRLNQVIRSLDGLASHDLYKGLQPDGRIYDDETDGPPWATCIERYLIDHVEYMGTRLREIGECWFEGSSTNVSNIAKGSRPQWNGSASELAYLLTELIEGNYIVPPARGRMVGMEGNRGAVADAVYAAIDIRDPGSGEPVTRAYFKSLLKPKSPDRGVYLNLFKVYPRK